MDLHRPSNFVWNLVAAAAVVVVVAGMRAATDIIVPFLLAVFIAVITTPVFFRLQRWRVPSGLAVLILMVGLAVIGLVGVGIVGKSLQGFSENLPDY